MESTISFDRAFDLASHTDGIWIAKTPSFAVVTCAPCTSEFLAALGAIASADSCPFCKLIQRYGHDPRLQSSFPTHPLPDPSAFLRGMMLPQGQMENGADPDTPARLPPLFGDTPGN